MAKAEQQEYLTVKEAAQVLGVTPLTVRRYIYRGLLDSQRTPGGQHRILLDDLRFLKKDLPEDNIKEAFKDQDLEARPGRAISWQLRVQKLEEEVELLRKQLAVVSSGCVRIKELVETPLGKMEQSGREISERLVLSVLGPGCQACDRLAALTEEILEELRLEHAKVKRVKDLEKIAEYGPLLTPALVLDGNVVMSGVVPSRDQLMEIIKAGLN